MLRIGRFDANDRPDQIADEFIQICQQENDIRDTANYFCVSRLAVINRARNVGLIGEQKYNVLSEEENSRYNSDQPRHRQRSKSEYGNAHYTLRSHLGKPFTYAVIASMFEGDTLYRDAAALLNINHSTINKLAETFKIR
ncbi:MAG: hypothetical protein LBI57_04200 [Helicobacteraceae bacterium]|nr:hypothetical protein [Helicobacteraceae bacterium]